MKIKNNTISKMNDCIQYPQENINIVTELKKDIMKDKDVLDFVANVEKEIENKGRILFRASGTEPKIRIMAEAESTELAKESAEKIEKYIRKKYNI